MMLTTATNATKWLTVLVLFIIPMWSLSAKELLLVSDDGPPHMIAETNTGIDIEITREVLNSLGHQVSMLFMPLARGKQQVQQKQADLFVPTFRDQDSENLYFSEPIIQYRPTVFSLNVNQFDFKTLSDIQGKTIVTFQGATGYFGEEFLTLSKTSGYRESHDMSQLPKLLLLGRYDVVVLDYYIFYYFLRQYCQPQQLTKSSTPTQQTKDMEYCQLEITEHQLIKPVSAYVGFHEQQLRNDFNQALKKYQQTEQPQRVIERYIGAR